MVPSAWTSREKIVLGSFIFIVVLFGIVYYFSDSFYQKKEKDQHMATYSPAKKKTEQKQVSQLMVDVKGAVVKPGIYQLPTGSRVYQAIQAAGGFLNQADQKQINLAQKCQDEMVIYVPVVGEPPQKIGENNGDQTEKKININTATVEELKALDSIGPAKAEAIVKYRENHGPFQSIDALTQVPGIGAITLDKFRDQLTLY